MPQKSQVYIDAALTNLSIAYRPSGFVADDVMRIIKVKQESGKYFKWDRGNALRVPETLRADGAESNKVTFDLSKNNSYSCNEYALNTVLTDRQKDNADSVLNLRANKMKFVKDLLLLDREKRVATALTTSGNYDTTVYKALSGTDQWNDDAFVGSIEKDIDTGKEAVRAAIGMYPNTIVIPAAVAAVIKRDPAIRELIKYTKTDLLVNGDLPPVLFGMRVLIPTAINITSVPGASSTTTADVWGKNVVMTYVPADGMLETPAHAYTVRAREFMVKTWREEKASAEVIEVSVIDDEIVTSDISGYLLATCIA